MRTNNGPSLSEIYGDMLNPISEAAIKKGGNDFKDKNPSPLIKGGATDKSGYKKALNDDLDDCDEDEESEDDEVETKDKKDDKKKKVVKESKKNSNTKLNTNMRNKSVFDKLYSQIVKENFDPTFGQEDAEDDIDALGLGDATPDDELGDDLGDEGGDEVSFTLPRETARALVDALQAILGDDDGAGEIEDDGLDFGDEGEGDFGGENFDEDEEREDPKKAPDAKGKYQGKGAAKVGGKPKPSGGAASHAVTDKTGNDGDHGHAISSGKQPNLGTGGSAKVSNLKQSSDFFK